MELREKFQNVAEGWVQATKEQYANHPLATLFRGELEDAISSLASEFNNDYKTKASVGSGVWANVPWISILDPQITTTAQEGIYPVYLVKADGTGIYLSLMQGTTALVREIGRKTAEKIISDIKLEVLGKLPELASWGTQEIDLSATTSLANRKKLNMDTMASRNCKPQC